MILPRYRVGASGIAGAGKGLFADELIAKGRVIIAPDNVHTVWPEAKLRGFASDSIEVESSVRWFEDQFSLTPEWSDECFVNHSFAPNALWHLGFIFALRTISADEEILMDYRHVIGSGEVMPFKDGETGREIVGLPWPQVLQDSAQQLVTILG
ncbi:MAG: SET domain-containing protein [Stagnimonas sp.]|nr:SET domain-containing protein [Stagnimonas sp.]